MRVLIVEDEPNLGRQLRATLEGAGYAIDLATDGEDGHYLGSTESYDAIILDLGLPVLDGLSVLQSWRQEGLKTPVLVLTARDTWSDTLLQMATQRHFALGAACYVLSIFVWILGLSRVPVSIAYPLLSLGYIVNAIAAHYLLGESVTASRWLGIGFIVVGVWLVGRS